MTSNLKNNSVINILINEAEKEIKIFFLPKSEGRIRYKLKPESNIYGFGYQIKKCEIEFLKNKSKLSKETKDFKNYKNNCNGICYIEWQITYNANKSSIKKEKARKEWLIEDCKYIDIKKTERIPYELSYILYHALRIKIISADKLREMYEFIKTIKNFLNEIKIETELEENLFKLGNSDKDLTFVKLKMKYPYFILYNKDNTFIEIHTEKQQYAYGVQPMIYFCIPIDLLKDGNEYVISMENGEVLERLILSFAYASENHKYDILEIINCINKLYSEGILIKK